MDRRNREHIVAGAGELHLEIYLKVCRVMIRGVICI